MFTVNRAKISLLMILVFIYLIKSQVPPVSNSNYKLSNGCPSSQEEEIKSLELKKSLTCAIEKGKTHRYQIEAEENQFINITIEKSGVDVTETINGPNKFIRKRDFLGGFGGNEMISFVAPQKGMYFLEVLVKDKKDPQSFYKITLTQQSAPTKKDYAREEAEEKFMQATKLPPNEIDKKISLLSESVSKWRESGDQYGLVIGLTSWVFARASTSELFEKKGRVA